MSAVRYRLVEPADVPRLAGLPRAGEAGGASVDRMQRYLAGEHHPQQALAARAMWVAETDEVPVGYAAAHLTRRFGCAGELQWIYVVPEQRRAGVATALLRLAADWLLAQGARRVCVDVGDDEARPFYRRRGATELDRHWMVWEDIASALNGPTITT